MAHWTQSPQWGEERRYTLQDMMAVLRMALSEPHSGAWGTVVYDIDKDFSPDVVDFTNAATPQPVKYAINELAYMINLAQVEVVRDLYERGYAFPEVTVRDRVYPGMDRLCLRGDFMAMESVFHICDKNKVRLEETSLKELQDSYEDGDYYTQDTYFTYYEVRGNAGTTIVSGQLGADDVLDYDDALQLSEAEIAKVAVGDFVLNETDGSNARVTEVDTEENIIELDELMGGRTDTFEALDFYSIQTASQPFEALHLWPKLKNVQEDPIYQGDPHGWTVKDYTIPTRLRFNMRNRPEGIHPYRSRIYASVLYDATPDASEPTWEQISGGALAAEWENGWNEVALLSEGDFEPGTQYYVWCATNDFDAEAETGVQFIPDQVAVFAAKRRNFLESTYTRLAIPLIELDDLCELPSFLVLCVIAYARMLAYLKKSNQPQADVGLMAEYESMVEKNLKFLNKRGESGPSNIFKNPRILRRSSRRFGIYVPPGYTNIVRF